SPQTTRHYRGTARNFLGDLGAAHPKVNSLYQLRREPHVDVALNGLQREFELARSKPRHLVPQPRAPFAPRAGLEGMIDSLLAAQHVLEMFIRALPNDPSPRHLDRPTNRPTNI